MTARRGGKPKGIAARRCWLCYSGRLASHRGPRMPNIGSLLRDEITRLSRKESRRQINSTKKSSAQYRRDIAALKRHVAQLERQVKLLARARLGTVAAAKPTSATKLRF